jgi:hypothetical protein
MLLKTLFGKLPERLQVANKLQHDSEELLQRHSPGLFTISTLLGVLSSMCEMQVTIFYSGNIPVTFLIYA